MRYILVASHRGAFSSRLWAASTLILNDEIYMYSAYGIDDSIEVLTANPFIGHVLIDYNIASQDDWDLLRIIKDDEIGWPYMKVIIVYEGLSHEDALEAWRLGADVALDRKIGLSTIVRNTLI